MKKGTANLPNEKTQEEIYLNLSRLLSRMDVGSNSYRLSAVAMLCEEKVRLAVGPLILGLRC